MITVYSKPNCMPCKFVKQLLDSEEIEYEVKDVGEDEQALEEFKGKGYMSTPITEYGDGEDDFISGFNPEQLKELK